MGFDGSDRMGSNGSDWMGSNGSDGIGLVFTPSSIPFQSIILSKPPNPVRTHQNYTHSIL